MNSYIKSSKNVQPFPMSPTKLYRPIQSHFYHSLTLFSLFCHTIQFSLYHSSSLLYFSLQHFLKQTSPLKISDVLSHTYNKAFSYTQFPIFINIPFFSSSNLFPMHLCFFLFPHLIEIKSLIFIRLYINLDSTCFHDQN